MRISQYIILLCFYIIGLSGCNKIGNHSYMHNGEYDDDIANLSKPDKPSNDGEYEDIMEQLNELHELVNGKGYKDDIANSDTLDNPCEQLTNKQFEGKKNETASIQLTKKKKQANVITPDLEVKILSIVKKNPDLGCNKISNIIYKEKGIDIIPNTIRAFLKRYGLGNEDKRKEAKNNRELWEITKSLEEKRQAITQELILKLKLKLKILIIVLNDETVGSTGISNKIYEQTGEYISDNMIKKFLKANNLQTTLKRYQAKKDGTLLKMIKETQAEIQAKKIK